MSSNSVQKKNLYLNDAILFVICIAIDRVCKFLADSRLKDRASVSLINSILEFRYTENTGAAFGVLKGQTSFFVLVSVVIVLTGLYFLIKSPGKRKYISSHIFISLILCGSVGNTLDRLLYGAVIDYIYFSIIDFPIFNIADIYSTVGTVGLIIVLIFVFKEDDLNFLRFKEKKIREI